VFQFGQSQQFQHRSDAIGEPPATSPSSPRDENPPLARAMREGRVVRLRARSAAPLEIHPVRLALGPAGWSVTCARTGASHPLDQADDINISGLRFRPV